MQSLLKFQTGLLSVILFALFGAISPGVAGVSQSIQDQYISDYENKAMFLKIPIYFKEQIIQIKGKTFRAVPGTETPLYKVGDQFRILKVDFNRNEILFRLGSIATMGESEIIYRFEADLSENFPNRETFDRALQSTFTEGLKYTDIDDAKMSFLKVEFDRSVGRIAGAASLSQEFVLENIAPLIPDYEETKREKDALEEKVEEISTQLTQVQEDSRKTDVKIKEKEDELSRLKGTNTSLREKMTNFELQISRLDKEILDANKKVQGYERELNGIKNSLNMEADSNRDLSKNNAELADRINDLQTDLENRKSENVLLVDENEDKSKEIRKLKSTIKTLTSNKDSIGRQYVKLKDEKEKLDDFARTIDALRVRMVEEKNEKGFFYGKADIYLNDVRVGSLDWSIPELLSHNESGSGKATFSAESIDNVQVPPEVRELLRTLGDKLKIGMELVALSPTMQTSSEDGTELHDLGERERYTWDWQIVNKGTQDVSVLLSAHLINSNSQKISLFRKEHKISTSNPVRRIRSYLHPVPLGVGIVIGFLLFGIVGIFRRPKSRKKPPPATPPGSSTETKHYVSEKKL